MFTRKEDRKWIDIAPWVEELGQLSYVMKEARSLSWIEIIELSRKMVKLPHFAVYHTCWLPYCSFFVWLKVELCPQRGCPIWFHLSKKVHSPALAVVYNRLFMMESHPVTLKGVWFVLFSFLLCFGLCLVSMCWRLGPHCDSDEVWDLGTRPPEGTKAVWEDPNVSPCFPEVNCSSYTTPAIAEPQHERPPWRWADAGSRPVSLQKWELNKPFCSS